MLAAQVGWLIVLVAQEGQQRALAAQGGWVGQARQIELTIQVGRQGVVRVEWQKGSQEALYGIVAESPKLGDCS